jgi:hypothetical protein
MLRHNRRNHAGILSSHPSCLLRSQYLRREIHQLARNVWAHNKEFYVDVKNEPVQAAQEDANLIEVLRKYFSEATGAA